MCKKKKESRRFSVYVTDEDMQMVKELSENLYSLKKLSVSETFIVALRKAHQIYKSKVKTKW